MWYAAAFIAGVIVGITALSCCVMAGEDDERNGRK